MGHPGIDLQHTHPKTWAILLEDEVILIHITPWLSLHKAILLTLLRAILKGVYTGRLDR